MLAVYQRWLKGKIAINKPNLKPINKETNKLEQIETKATTENHNQNLFHSVHHEDKSQYQFYIKIFVVAALSSVNFQFYNTSYLMNNCGYRSPASNGLHICSGVLLMLTDGHWDRL